MDLTEGVVVAGDRSQKLLREAGSTRRTAEGDGRRIQNRVRGSRNAFDSRGYVGMAYNWEILRTKNTIGGFRDFCYARIASVLRRVAG